MRKNYLLLIIGAGMFVSHFTYAQENKSIDQKGVSGRKEPVKNKIEISIAGGATIASGKMKDSLFIGNGWNLEAGVYLPIFYSWHHQPGNFDNAGKSYFNAGIESMLNYTRQKADGGVRSYTNSFYLQGGTITPEFEGSTPSASSLQALIGARANWGWGKIVLSPSFLAGYLTLSRKAYTLSNTLKNPKQNAEGKYIPFISAANYTASGFVMQPRLELSYHLTSQFSLLVAGSMAFGPSIQNNIAYWKPQGSAGTNGSYSYDQFANGAAKAAVFSNHWQATSINMGLRYTWIKGTFDKGHSGRKQRDAKGNMTGRGDNSVNEITTGNPLPGTIIKTEGKADSNNNSRLSMTPTTAKQTQGVDFGEKVAGGLQSGAGALSQGASVSRLSMTPTTTKQTQGTDFGEKVAGGLQSGAGALSQGASVSRLSMTPTTTKQTQGTDFGEKVAGGLQSGAGALSQGASKNRLSMTPTTTKQTQGTNFGEKVAGGLQSGAGALSQGASVSRLSMTPTTAKQTQGTDFGKKVAGGLQSGAGALSQGASKNRLSMTPTTTKQTQGTDFGEKVANGLNRTDEDAELARHEQRIKGIILKGGKPGGRSISLVSNEKGEILLNNLEGTIYLFQLSTPKRPVGKSINKTEIKSANNGTMIRPDLSVTDILVKGGKNPGEDFADLTVNNNGQISFKVLAAGNYKLVISKLGVKVPANNGKNSKKRKVIEKTSSGLKDVMKTNV